MEHAEAGWRLCDRGLPEEINRVVTDVMAEVLLVSEPAEDGACAKATLHRPSDGDEPGRLKPAPGRSLASG